MSSLMESHGIDRLSPAERMQLVEEILESLANGQQPYALSEATRRELDRRLAVLEADPASVTPWQEVEARILAKLRR